MYLSQSSFFPEVFLKRDTLQKIMYFLFDHITDTRFYGLENIPKEGRLIVATNHMSRIDIPTLFVNPVRPEITALVADKYTTVPGLNWIIKTAGGIYLDRERADFSAFREAQTMIKDGIAMGIAPEGTRSKTGQLLEGKPGTILLAVRTGAQIIPVGLSGTDTAFRRLFTFRKPRIAVRFGHPFEIRDIPRENREAVMKEITDDILCRIAVLLPPRYWGFYRDHPRLKELLEEQGGPVKDEW
jgi:1-acyl-sn-glycerol-3-phosphate acyltransferase